MLDKIHPSYKKTTTTTNNKNNNFTALWDVTLYHLVSTCTDSLEECAASIFSFRCHLEWWQQIPLKHGCLFTELHGVTSKKTVILMTTVVRTSYHTL